MGEPRELGIKKAWATTFYQRQWHEHAVEAPSIVERLIELREHDCVSIASGVAAGAKSSGGLYESGFDLFSDQHAGLQKLVAFSRETLQVAVSHINGGTTPPNRLEVKFPDSWCHITGSGGFHDAHYHSSCSWCGIYYLRLGDYEVPATGNGAPNGGSRFYSPLPLGGRYQDYGNHYLSDNSLDPPLREGLLLLFPSYLLHSGLPYLGQSQRIVIAFNAQIQLVGP
jgi:uncharacterized protein (TIGR02466 family)